MAGLATLLFAFGKEIGASRGESEDTADDGKDPADGPSRAEMVIGRIPGHLIGRLGRAEGGNLEEDEHAGNDEADDGDKVQKTGEFVEGGDLQEGEDSAQEKDNDSSDQKNEGDNRGGSGLDLTDFAGQTAQRGGDFSAEDAEDARIGIGVARDCVCDRRAGHQQDDGNDSEYGRNQAGEL